jgi:Mn2+/Fe2+ NRAMP family transporter
MVMMMLLGSRSKIMGKFTLSAPLKIIGWIATGVMALAAAGMFATMGSA